MSATCRRGLVRVHRSSRIDVTRWYYIDGGHGDASGLFHYCAVFVVHDRWVAPESFIVVCESIGYVTALRPYQPDFGVTTVKWGGRLRAGRWVRVSLVMLRLGG